MLHNIRIKKIIIRHISFKYYMSYKDTTDSIRYVLFGVVSSYQYRLDTSYVTLLKLAASFQQLRKLCID